ncbi:MAG: hypothetical protein COB02_06690 [Candidatus Cloacimonadota bacterium]|nr:MAG: hypothetical protein COB02_06690 [Candidatus Cloacimonadota bacterium]
MSKIDKDQKVNRRKALSMAGIGGLSTYIASVFSPSDFILKGDKAPKIRSNKLSVQREKRG